MIDGHGTFFRFVGNKTNFIIKKSAHSRTIPHPTSHMENIITNRMLNNLGMKSMFSNIISKSWTKIHAAWIFVVFFQTYAVTFIGYQLTNRMAFNILN